MKKLTFFNDDFVCECEPLFIFCIFFFNVAFKCLLALATACLYLVQRGSHSVMSPLNYMEIVCLQIHCREGEETKPETLNKNMEEMDCNSPS